MLRTKRRFVGEEGEEFESIFPLWLNFMESNTFGILAAFRKKDLSEKVVKKMGSIKPSAC